MKTGFHAVAAAISAACFSSLVSAFGLPEVRKSPKTAEPSRTVGSSRNGGQRSGNRMHQRMAKKRRNVARNRLAHRG